MLAYHLRVSSQLKNSKSKKNPFVIQNTCVTVFGRNLVWASVGPKISKLTKSVIMELDHSDLLVFTFPVVLK